MKLFNMFQLSRIYNSLYFNLKLVMISSVASKCQDFKLLMPVFQPSCEIKLTTSKQRENRLRDSLGKFITLHKARAVNLGDRSRNKTLPRFSSWKFVMLVNASQNQKNLTSFLTSHAPRNWATPTGSQVCPGTLKRFRSTPSHWNGPLFLGQLQLL